MEGKELNINDTEEWNVRSCRPRFRHDQIAKGLWTLDGVSDLTGRILAARIPAAQYPADIKAVLKYCCKHFCQGFKGARLHNGARVKGFLAIPKKKGYMITLK